MKVTLNRFIHMNASTTVDDPSFEVFASDMTNYGYVFINQQDIMIDIPDDFNPVPLQIAALKKTQQSIRAEAERKAAALDEQIQKLLAIEAPKVA